MRHGGASLGCQRGPVEAETTKNVVEKPVTVIPRWRFLLDLGLWTLDCSPSASGLWPNSGLWTLDFGRWPARSSTNPAIACHAAQSIPCTIRTRNNSLA